MALISDYANAQELITIESIERNTVLFKDGGLRQVLLVEGVNVALKSEEEQNALVLSYQNFLNSIDFPIQLIIHSRKVNIDLYLQNLKTREHDEPSALLKNQMSEYRSFIEGFVRENAIMQKLFLVVVPFNPIIVPTAGSALSFLPFRKKTPEELQKKEESERATFDHNCTQLTQRVNQVLEGVRTVGLQATVLDDEALIDLYYNFYNPESAERETLPLPTEPQQSFTPRHGTE